MTEATAPNVIKIKDARLSYPFVYNVRGKKGKKGDEKDGRFEASFLLDPSNAAHAKTIAALKAEAARVATEAFPKEKLSKLKLCFGVNPEDSEYCPGWFYLQTWNKERPLVVNRNRTPTVSEEDVEGVFAGCYVNTNTTFFAWEFTDDDTGMVKKGVSANLRSVQFVRGSDEDRFGKRSRLNVEDEFDEIGEAANVAGGADPFDD